MQDAGTLMFGPFRADLTDERVWRQEAAIHLTHKAFSVLCCLLTRPGQLVTKDDLFKMVWPDVVVSESTLTGCIQEVRRALGDRARYPQFIETVHGRGYRFIAPVTAIPSPDVTSLQTSPPSSQSAILSPPPLVGREAEFDRLRQCFRAALQGRRQIGFIAGEAGIGKTALVETFMAQLAAENDMWLGRGQCVDHYGVGEAYLPLLEALGRLCREPNGDQMIALLRQQAPSWLAQMPGLLFDAEYERLQHTTSGATQTRMLRELAEALEVLTAECPLVLILEDLHWSDTSTLEWLTYVARRRDPAHLLVLGTYRPAEAIVREHPLRAVVSELEQHALCDHLTLDYLREEDVATYLRQRFGSKPLPAGFTSLLHQRTNGNPLFFITVLDDLVRHGVIVEGQDVWCLSDGLDSLINRVPESLQRLIELAVEQLTPEEQAILEAASVAGSAFSVAVVAASTGQSEDSIEARCATWSRQGRFVRDSGMETWPNGTVTSCYRFIHALYHEVLYDRVPAARCLRLHQQIGDCKETAYGSQAVTIAAELAVHFEQARDLQRAVRYCQQAAENVIQRSAHAEAVSHLSTGLDLLKTLPVTPEHTRLELEMQTALSMVLMPIKGYGAPETEQALARIRALSQQVDESPPLVSALMVMRSFYLVRGEYRAALGVDDQLVRLGQRLHDDKILAWCHGARGAILLLLGELDAAQTHLEQAGRFNVPQKRRDLASRYGRDTSVHGLSWGCWSTWLLGYPQQALEKSQQAIRRAEELGSVYCLAFALSMSTILHQCRREWQLTRRQAGTLMALCQEEAFSFFMAMARLRLGWSLAMGGKAEEGIAQLHQGLGAARATGNGINRTYFLTMLAEAYAINGQVEVGLETLENGLQLVQTLDERFYEAELHRLKGELLLNAACGVRHAELTSEECFYKALDIARQQQAKSLELRAAISLSRLWQQQQKQTEAHSLLAEIYGWFREGFDTPDLQEARALLVADRTPEY